LKQKGLECHFKNGVLEVLYIDRELSFTESELSLIKDAMKTKADEYVYPSNIEIDEHSSDSEIQGNSSVYDLTELKISQKLKINNFSSRKISLFTKK
jgi:hypothetical protein